MAKKRANGEGNIRKRKDGRWEGRYTAGYDEKTGKRLIKNVLGKTQAEVKEKLAKAVAQKRKPSMYGEQTSTRSAHGCKRGMSYTQSHTCDSRLPNTTGAASNCISRRVLAIFRSKS